MVHIDKVVLRYGPDKQVCTALKGTYVQSKVNAAADEVEFGGGRLEVDGPADLLHGLGVQLQHQVQLATHTHPHCYSIMIGGVHYVSSTTR